MKLKPNYARGFMKMTGWFLCLIIFMSGVVPYLQGEPVDWFKLVSMAFFGGVLVGIGACAIFTPREISWDDEKISLRVNFRKSGEYSWQKLEAYSTWSGRFGTFLLKFEGVQSYQIVPACFSAGDWKAFESFLRTRFPEKKAWIWFNSIPVRFGKK